MILNRTNVSITSYYVGQYLLEIVIFRDYENFCAFLRHLNSPYFLTNGVQKTNILYLPSYFYDSYYGSAEFQIYHLN